ncbi:MAG: hypothetical protein U5N58_01770 [Actinomycetota bacterium]|nr:hypothetical protein [Actinomycetota bacterium]
MAVVVMFTLPATLLAETSIGDDATAEQDAYKYEGVSDSENHANVVVGQYHLEEKGSAGNYRRNTVLMGIRLLTSLAIIHTARPEIMCQT